jgi:predicted Zn-dependent protease
MVLPVDAGAVREVNPSGPSPMDAPPSTMPPVGRRRQPFPSAPKKKKTGFVVSFGLIGFVVVVAIIVSQLARIGERPWRPKQQPLAFVEDNEERRQEVLEAFRKQKPLAADEIAAELKPLFDGLGRALKRGDGQACVDWFDTERMVDELLALEVVPAHMARRRGELNRGLRTGMSNALAQQAPLMEWVDFEIRRVKKLEGNEAMVIVRHRTSDGMFLKMRWWVTKRPGSWKIFDFEDLDGGLRFSTLAADVGRDRLQQGLSGMEHLRQAMLSAANNDADGAERALNQIGGQNFPKKFEAVRHLIHALVHLQRQNAQAALDAMEQVQRFNPDMPILDRLKGTAFNLQGRWEDALKHLTIYEDLLGDDFQVCFERGEALRGLGRIPEARASYRKALKYDGKGADAFLGLIRTLEPGAKRDELAELFAGLDNPQQNFDIAADSLVQSRDGPALEQLVQAMRQRDPNHKKVDYYQALALAWAGKTGEALPLFQNALRGQNDPGKRKQWLTVFLQAMVDAGKSLEAYQALPDARETFRVLADDLRYRMADLKPLLALHAKKHADDPMLPLCQAQIHVQEGKFEVADQVFTKAFGKNADPDLLRRFRHDWVLARYRIGKGRAAYVDIQPRHETFLDLASMCLGDRNYTLLELLVDAHAKNEPDSLDVVQYRIRLKIKQEKVPDGIALFNAVLAREDNADRRQRLVSSFLYDMVDAGKGVEAYQSAPDPRKALEILGPDLLGRGGGQDLKKILDLHRQRHGDDPLISIYLGEFHVAKQEWKEAAQAFATAWAKGTKDQHMRYRLNYVFALYKTGRHLEAYQKIEPRQETFRQLANLMIMDKKGADLEALLAAHRANAKDHPDLLLYEARAKILLRKPAEAIPLFQQAYQKQTNHYLRRNFLTDFLLDMQEAGQTVDGYRAAPDKPAAFDILANSLVFRKKDKELALLLAEHGKAEEPISLFYSGELHFLRNELAQAEKDFAAGLAKTKFRDQWKYRQALNRTGVKAGKAADTYRSLGLGNTQHFQDLAHLCLNQKDARQLAELVALHRQANPDDESLFTWDLDVLWLKNDFAGALKLLDERREDLLARFRWKYANMRVRCLARLQRTKEAIKEAEEIFRTGGNMVLLVYAHAAGGTAKNTIAAVEKLMPRRYLLEDCYHDPDLGPILRSDAFAEFRRRFPPPKENQPWVDPLDD